jgi:hypothetical protein
MNAFFFFLKNVVYSFMNSYSSNFFLRIGISLRKEIVITMGIDSQQTK